MRKNYSMFSEKGNRVVDQMVNEILKLPISITNKELIKEISTRITNIEKDHPEVFDTAVRECFIGAINEATGRELSIYAV